VLFINGPVVVVMAEQPVVIMCSLLDLLQEICERVCLIVSVFHESNAGGSAVRDNIVHRPIDLIRICLTQRDVFKRQLRAILRSSAFGKVAIMFPMIISVQEVRDARAILEECKAELIAKNIAVGEIEVGIMIETPAAVMIADELAQEVDFFSIGTNDLTQYTLAIDRQNPMVEALCDTHHPAILRMIRMTVDAAHRHHCWVGLCGELGADESLTADFLRMGLDELSVAPSAVLSLRKTVRSINLS